MIESIVILLAVAGAIFVLRESIAEFFKGLFDLFIEVVTSSLFFALCGYWLFTKIEGWRVGTIFNQSDSVALVFLLLAFVERFWRKFDYRVTGGMHDIGGLTVYNPYAKGWVGPRVGLSYLLAGCIAFVCGALARM